MAAPSGSAASLVLATPTQDEMLHACWEATHPLWGNALSLEGYIERESAQASIPLARDGGLERWILTTGEEAPAVGGENEEKEAKVETAVPGSIRQRQRPVLSSCETLRKPVLVRARSDGVISQGYAYGIGSVFTLPEHRRKGYAKVLLSKLAERLQLRRHDQDGHPFHDQQGEDGTARGSAGADAETGGQTVCSVLYSDIGQHFYASIGWAPYESTHLEIPAPIPGPSSDGDNAVASGSAAAGGGGGVVSSPPAGVTILESGDLPALAARDCDLIRALLARSPPASSSASSESNSASASAAASLPPKDYFAILPIIDQIRWHHAREALVCSHVFGRDKPPPTTHGALYTAASGARVWALWTRGYSAGPADPSKNTLYILRLVVDDEESERVSDAELSRALDGILGMARHQAALWACGKAEMWNPSDRVKRLVLAIPDLSARYVVREEDSITSLNWLAAERAPNEIEWLANEKYAWC